MKRIFTFKILIIATLLSAVLYSCEDVIEVDLNEENIDLISVEAYLENRPTDNVYVKLQSTLPVDNSEQNPPINDAVVEISDNENYSNSVVLKEVSNSGIYVLPGNVTYEAQPDKTYYLRITTSDGVQVTASDYMKKVETLDSVKVNLSARGDFEFLAIFISSQETPGEGDYYKWDIYINNNLLYESENLSFASDELVDGNYIYDFEIFTDFYEDDEDQILRMGDTIYVEQLSITAPIYDFYLGMVNQAFAGNPFSVPPANVQGNLSSSDNKRVLGFFSARDVSPGNTVIIGEDNFAPLKHAYQHEN
ncbi:DUF4249 domain-containing protein [Maribellus sediminis]|uniref:DUF4249 domain-containing protein n=1 Tax=Maribellus sediminis TaxID=2696285 RepID=UPI00142F7B7C|nr:DUF4249 domain-containing protein [Maribellus sediminis]